MKDFKPNVLSDVLLAEYVLKTDDTERFRLDPSWKSSEHFDDYVVLYKIATVLLALMNVEQKNPNYLEVRLIFEKAIFTDGNVHKLYFYHEVKAAIKKMGELIDASNYKLETLDDQNNKIPWTMAGLRAAGILCHDQAIVNSSAICMKEPWGQTCLLHIGMGSHWGRTLTLDIGFVCVVPTRPEAKPYMRFLSVVSHVCHRLVSRKLSGLVSIAMNTFRFSYRGPCASFRRYDGK